MKPRNLFPGDHAFLTAVPPDGTMLPSRKQNGRATRLIQWRLLKPHRAGDGVRVTLSRKARTLLATIQQKENPHV